LMGSGADLACDILIAGEQTLPQFVEQAGPRLLITESFNKPFESRQGDRRAKPLVPDLQALDTERDGSITLELDSAECRVAPALRPSFTISRQ